MGQHIVFLFLRFCTFFKTFHVNLGKKPKNVSFYRRVCRCKGKTNICYFFSNIFLAPFPNTTTLFEIIFSEWDRGPEFGFHSKV